MHFSRGSFYNFVEGEIMGMVGRITIEVSIKFGGDERWGRGGRKHEGSIGKMLDLCGDCGGFGVSV